MEVVGTARRLDLDRLRVVACLTTFCYHAIQIFDLNPLYHVKSVMASPALDAAGRLLHAVRMPLFFLVAGMVGYMLALRYADRELIRQRAWRLLPPFVVGIVLLTPWIKYVEVLGGRSIGWHGITDVGGPLQLHVVVRRYFTQLNWFSWSHMWFLLYLFIVSAALLPVLRRLARVDWEPGNWAAAALLAPLAMLIAVEVTARPVFPWHIPNLFWDWASVLVYLISFLWGAALLRWPPLEAAIQRGVVAWSALAGCGAALYLEAGSEPLHGIGRALWLWSILCLAIGCGPWLAQGRVPGERYLSEAALPLYVLHHLPLVVIGYLLKDMPWPIWQRYAVIVLAALAVTLALYHLAVRPFNAMRLALGMPPLRGRPDLAAHTST